MKKVSSNLALLILLIIQVSCGPRSAENNPTNNTSMPMDTSDNFSVKHSEEEWKKLLTSKQYEVLREKGTERPFTGQFYLHKEKGMYVCAACGNELFSSDMKFDSDCGWPSFDKEIPGGKIKKVSDSTHGMLRTEIVCARCGSHLGHLFNDGPTETGNRYCVNSLSLNFNKDDPDEKK